MASTVQRRAALLQTSFTGFCPLERILGRVGLFGCRPGNASGAAGRAAA